jgi:hypothetical protein
MADKSLLLVLGLVTTLGCAKSAPPPSAPSSEPASTTQNNQADYTPPEQLEVSFEAKPAKAKATNDEAYTTSLRGNTAAPQKQSGLLRTTK